MDEALIHLRVPSALKADWVRKSRMEGKKLTDWIVDRTESKDMPIDMVLEEAAALARSLEDTPLFYSSKQAAEGIVTIQQQAQRYADAIDNATRLDAALWAREGYQLLSAGLPDTYTSKSPDERTTAWGTANQLSRLFGGEELWRQRCQNEFT